MSADIQEFDYSVDLMRSILWQYNDAERLQALIQAKQDWYNKNQRDFWQGWFDDVFNVETANDFGLSVWAKILGISFSASEGEDEPGKPIFGFASSSRNFDNSNFAKSSGATVVLTKAQKRLVVKLRYMQLLSRGTVPEINEFLKAAFSEYGDVWVLDPQDMSFAIFTFGFEPDTTVQFVLDKYDLLPRPAAVGSKIRIVTRKPFGFGNSNENFNNGTFI